MLSLLIFAAAASPTLQSYGFQDLPALGTTPAGDTIKLGGFSGLAFLGEDKAKNLLKFVTLTDRGPNSEPTKMPQDGEEHRAFVLPEFAPELIHFNLNMKTRRLEIVQRTKMTGPDGKSLSGQPVKPGNPGTPGDDETGVDLLGKPLSAHPLGIDPECLAVAPDGTYWIGEEYYPSILHLDRDGKLMERFISKGAKPATATSEALPEALLMRTANRGFEGLALSGTKIYAFVQSPLGLFKTVDGKKAPKSDFGRIVVFDTTTKQTIAQYLYKFEGEGSDKIGDVTVGPDGNLWVLERNDKTGDKAKKTVFSLDLSKATDITGLTPPPELQTPDDLAKGGVVSAAKTLVVDLAKLGLKHVEKLEGLAFMGDSTLAIVNDDDFGLKVGFDPKSGKLDERKDTPEGEHLFLVKWK